MKASETIVGILKHEGAKILIGYLVTRPDEIVPAIHRGIEHTQKKIPALLEFVLGKKTTDFEILIRIRSHSSTPNF